MTRTAMFSPGYGKGVSLVFTIARICKLSCQAGLRPKVARVLADICFMAVEGVAKDSYILYRQ